MSNQSRKKAATTKGNRYRGQPRPRRRWLALLLLLALLLAGLSGLFVSGYRLLLRSAVLEIARIQVRGCERLREKEVIQQAGIAAGTNILALDLDLVRQRLQSHPWIAAATVMREIPDSIRIHIRERHPVALVKGKEFYLMDSDTVCFAVAAPTDYPLLPIVSGIDAASIRLGEPLPPGPRRAIQAMRRQASSILPWRLLSEISWREESGLTAYTLRDGTAIVLGRQDFAAKIARLEKVLRLLEARGLHRHLTRIDLTYRDRVFVRGEFANVNKGV